MREISFKAKRKDNGDWIEGFLTICDERYFIVENGKVDCLCFDILPKGQYVFMPYIEVDQSTVSQFTGLTDKNGKKIFEGDIVLVLGNQQVDDWKNVDYVALIAFLDGGFCAIDGTVEEHGFRRYALARMDFSLEIIGNQFDNPELLENP